MNPRALAAGIGHGLFLGATLAVARRRPGSIPLMLGSILIACGIAALAGSRWGFVASGAPHQPGRRDKRGPSDQRRQS